MEEDQQGNKQVSVDASGGEEEKKCPPCKAGAPAWMATFADMATLLMAFFVLILSFAEMNVPKFKQISGSLSNAFGVQRVVPVVEQPMGTTVIDLTFSPSPSPSVTAEMTQETEDREQVELELQTKTKESDYDTNAEKEKVQLALAEEIARGQVEVVTSGENVVVQFTSDTAAEDKNQPELHQEALDALEKLADVAQEVKSGLVVKMDPDKLSDILQTSSQQKEQSQQDEQSKKKSEQQNEMAGNPTANDTVGNGKGDSAVDMDMQELTVALKQQIDQGLVELEKKDGRIIITVGSGGSFPLGKAELTNEAKELMSAISDVTKESSSGIIVKGHTDNVPLLYNEKYRDNWDLSTARAVSVIKELSDKRGFPENKLSAIGYADSKPVKDNDTPENRTQNRRIEIEIEYVE